ncbi:pentapeptide repeat-containing protein [Saccharothrix coeruleofusca]|uniref:Pentapeptide repeat protein n=1 Tax=Saccharothrix coeruleofusca TaxID=33919 RepID=A0A918ALX0_9PSEU|nr:pentapeptide repeat-containing protein [Saccharothrix coeruleofusca]MBP2338176.1 uncharacterized protein YjbI with pentapeptide repeats [Saccharothrix coeruleofusca]GGP50276.1 hypothetical protein GCM10010185_23090 [Saccharothrix coeruleofusca]
MSRELRADCASCFGLCCVVPAFSRSSDFALDKPAGTPCPNLGQDFRCGIHDRLRQKGFVGCTVYDCFGAGQRVSRETFGGVDWREPGVARRMFEVFPVVRNLHELLWYLTEAVALVPGGALRDELVRARDETELLAGRSPEALAGLDVGEHRRAVNALLLRASDFARSSVRKKLDRRGADLIGRSFKGADLRGASLRGALLMGADLRRADLRQADLTGADLRGADLRGADLSGALFLTQAQLDAAKGDRGTKLPGSLAHPAHWAASSGLRPEA